MNRALSYYSLAWIFAALQLSCGAIHPSDKRKDLDAEADQGGQPVALQLVADYELKPVDVVLMRENQGFFSNGGFPFAKRLYSEQDQAVAYKNLAVRLFNSALDLQFGVMNVAFNSKNEANANSGALFDGGSGEPRLEQKPGFINQAFARMATSGGDRGFSYPMLSIKRLLERSEIKYDITQKMVRDDAILSILYVGILDEVDDSFDTADIIALLDATKGKGNWIVSAIIPDEAGCSYRQLDDSPRHTNDIYEPDPAKIASYARRNKVLKLQQYSGGLFRSICDSEYVTFMDEFVHKGTQSAFFDLELELPADPDTIEIRVNSSVVTGWRYLASEKILQIPTTIETGTEFSLSYLTPMGKLKEEVYDSSEDIEHIPDVEDIELSPAKIAFLNEVRPIMLANCTTGGCHGNVFSAGVFEDVWPFRASIVDRMNRNSAAVGFMPQTPNTISNADKDIILNWINTYD